MQPTKQTLNNCHAVSSKLRQPISMDEKTTLNPKPPLKATAVEPRHHKLQPQLPSFVGQPQN